MWIALGRPGGFATPPQVQSWLLYRSDHVVIDSVTFERNHGYCTGPTTLDPAVALHCLPQYWTELNSVTSIINLKVTICTTKLPPYRFAYFADFCCFQPRFWLFLRLLAAGNLLKMGGLAPRGSPTHFRRLPAACSLRKRQNLGRKHQKVSSMQPIGKEITNVQFGTLQTTTVEL